MKTIKNYVEEIWVDHFITSNVQEIESIEGYLSNANFNASLLGFRFFQVVQLTTEGRIYTSEPENFTEWISNNRFDDFDEVVVGNKKIKWSNCISAQEYISKIQERAKIKTKSNIHSKQSE